MRTTKTKKSAVKRTDRMPTRPSSDFELAVESLLEEISRKPTNLAFPTAAKTEEGISDEDWIEALESWMKDVVEAAREVDWQLQLADIGVCRR